MKLSFLAAHAEFSGLLGTVEGPWVVLAVRRERTLPEKHLPPSILNKAAPFLPFPNFFYFLLLIKWNLHLASYSCHKWIFFLFSLLLFSVISKWSSKQVNYIA